MEVSNRALILLAAGASGLAVLAYGLTNDLVSVPTPPVDLTIVPVSPTIEVTKTSKMKLEERVKPVTISAEPSPDLTTVLLQCGVYKRDLAFVEGKAVFTSVPPATDCTVTMRGAKVGYSPVFSGDEVTCVILDEHTECVGGVAKDHPALLHLESDVKGEIFIDDDWFGMTPAPKLRVKPGRRSIRIKLPGAVELTWVRIFNPDEKVRIHFPTPGNYRAPEGATPAQSAGNDAG